MSLHQLALKSLIWNLDVVVSFPQRYTRPRIYITVQGDHIVSKQDKLFFFFFLVLMGG